MNNAPDTIKVSEEMVELLYHLVDNALKLEGLTGKRTGITSFVGEMLVCYKYKLFWVVKDNNDCYDAIDKKGKLVQIKARRKGNAKKKEGTGQKMGNILDKDFKVEFDYLIFVLLDDYYKPESFTIVEGQAIQTYFDKKNMERTKINKLKVKSASYKTIVNLAYL